MVSILGIVRMALGIYTLFGYLDPQLEMSFQSRCYVSLRSLQAALMRSLATGGVPQTVLRAMGWTPRVPQRQFNEPWTPSRKVQSVPRPPQASWPPPAQRRLPRPTPDAAKPRGSKYSKYHDGFGLKNSGLKKP